MAEIDRLDIVIATSVKDAKAQITQLQSELKAMKKTMATLTNTNPFKQTGRNASSASNSVRQQSRQMVKEYKKAITTMDTIRDKMAKKTFTIPDTAMGAKEALENYQKMYQKAREKVLSAQAHGEKRGKVYRNNVEDMYRAAEGIKAARSVLREKAAKDEAYQRLLDEERAAREAAQSVEQLATAYDDVAKSSSKVNAKYVNRSLLANFKNAYDQGQARIGASPYIKRGGLNLDNEENNYRSLRDTISSMADSIRNKAQEMKSAVGVAFDNMKAKVDNFKLSMREKAVANGILSYTQDFVTLQKSIDKTRADYARLTQAMQEYKAAGGAESDTTYRRYQARAERMSGELDASMKAAKGMKMDGSAYEINTKTAEANLARLKSSFQKVGNAAKSAARSVGSFLLKVTGIKGAANKAKSAMNNVTGLAKKLTKELTRVSKMLKLMITRMALRAVISNVGEGFQSLALHSAKFNESMSNLINSAKTLGYSIAGMVSPLINALAPALVTIINLVTQAVNAINQLFAALTGAGTWNRAKTFTDSWADSIKGASGAAKELKKTVLGFDELNQLQDNKSSGGGNGGLKDMFETVNIDPKWKEMAEWLKEMWGNKDFTELGAKLGQKLKDALDSIPWAKIRQTSNDLGKVIATLINGFIEVEGLAGSIGKTVAQGVNTVFEFINGFVKNIHWSSIGKFIAETFNGFFEGIDWRLIEETVVTGLKGLAESINSFVRHFNWDNISNFISKAVNTVAKGIYTFVKEVDWKQLGTELGNQLNETIKKIDWRQIGKAIGSIIQSAINFVKSFIKQLNWADIKKAISDLLKGFFEEVNKEDLVKLVAGIIVFVMGKAVVAAIASAGLKGLGSTLLSALFGGTAISGATTAASAAGVSIGGAIAGGIGLGLAGINLIKDPLWDLTVKLGANEEKVKNLKDAYSGWDGTLKFVKESLQETWYKITGQDDKLKDLYGTTKVLTDEYGNATKTIDYFGDTVIEIDSKIGDVTKTTQGQIEVYDNWKSSISDATDAAKIGSDRMYDFKIAVDEAGKVSSTVSEHIFPKLGENTYKAASAQESINKAVADYKQRLEDVKNHQVYYKTTTDVIREAQEKNVKVVEASAKEYEVLKDDVGNVTIKLQDNKPAFEKAGDAAKDANKKVADYVGTTKDNIRILPENTKKLGEDKTAYDKDGEAAKEAGKKVGDYKGVVEETTRKIPDMTKGVQDVGREMGHLSKDAEDATRQVSQAFTKDRWTFSGVAEGLKSTFESARSSIKNVWNDIADKLNGEHDIGDSKIRINLPKFAAGGFPDENGLFMANSSEMVGRFTNGRTAVANNAMIVDGIQAGVYNAVTSALANSNSGSNGYISNTIVVDGEVIARTITKAQEKTNRRYSPQTV